MTASLARASSCTENHRTGVACNFLHLLARRTRYSSETGSSAAHSRLPFGFSGSACVLALLCWQHLDRKLRLPACRLPGAGHSTLVACTTCTAGPPAPLGLPPPPAAAGAPAAGEYVCQVAEQAQVGAAEAGVQAAAPCTCRVYEKALGLGRFSLKRRAGAPRDRGTGYEDDNWLPIQMKSCERLSWRGSMARRGDAPLRFVLHDRESVGRNFEGGVCSGPVHSFRQEPKQAAVVHSGIKQRAHTQPRADTAVRCKRFTSCRLLPSWGSCWLTWTNCAHAPNRWLGLRAAATAVGILLPDIDIEQQPELSKRAQGTAPAYEGGAFMLWWLAALLVVAAALFAATRTRLKARGEQQALCDLFWLLSQHRAACHSWAQVPRAGAQALTSP